MKNTVTGIILAMFVAKGATHARSCPASANTEILKGLQNLSTDPMQTGEMQQRAAFVASLIHNSSTIACDFNSGIIGSIYNLETATHLIHIGFAGSTITNLRTERISFN